MPGLVLGLLAACQAQAPVASSDECGASRLRGWIGQPVGTLDEQYLPQTVRLIRPDQPVTEDFSATRLNVTADDRDRITGFWCG
ncbi:I78 family peptidase inhibitor [Gemmobacter denitrificans]|uniref:I78 family peptidase inhibitor n=1 Tax=Gemmobacter denitrificans TaxID=3123040 RepID=A0ABU8C0P8_9RHOB